MKVVDFGIAGMGGDKVDAGTLSYMAPECLEKVAAETSPAIDVWAIGVMFYAMLFGELPFDKSAEKDLIHSIKNDQIRFPSKIPVTSEAKEIIKQMLNKDPTQRLKLIEFVGNYPYAQWEEEEINAKIEEVI